jgi:ankyrin repeat protein
MNDLKHSCVFNDVEEEDDEWNYDEEEVYWYFKKNISNVERDSNLAKIKVKQKHLDNIVKSQYAIDQEKRIQAKIKEMTEKGLREPDLNIETPDGQAVEPTTRYGRSPLHEAVAMRDIRLVKKYLKIGKFLDKVDNNDHTAMEMAYYDNYKEALVLFEKYS